MMKRADVDQLKALMDVFLRRVEAYDPSKRYDRANGINKQSAKRLAVEMRALLSEINKTL